MASKGNAPSWAEQWDSHKTNDQNKQYTKQNSSRKMADMNAKMKATALASMEKAKSAASVGAQKVKVGTNVGVKWVKAQYQKITSK